MTRHGFGRGEYKYFDYPLPHLIETLRTGLYTQLAPIANEWNTAMKIPVQYPATHAEFIQRCHDAGQTRPTPLLLEYGTGDFNCLHQDLYGEHVFPLQAAFLIELAAKLHGGKAPASFVYRGLQPLFDGSEFSVNASDTPDGMELWTANSAGQPTMKGTATW